jgi:hypothetical protein
MFELMTISCEKASQQLEEHQSKMTKLLVKTDLNDNKEAAVSK